ncbi:MAG: hypothetical protein AAF727_05685 [Pseudomonadota bacterium]
MRALLFPLFLLLATSAFAQQERECRGKQGIDLGDGAAGCLLELGTTNLTTTTTRDDGASQKVRKRVTGLIEVALFGAYSPSKQVTSQRIRAVCQTFLHGLQERLGDQKYSRIVIVLFWPRIENPGTFVSKDRSKVAVQPAYSSAACRGVKYLS